jgi:two-component system, LytTR family, sensor kinase
VILALNPAKERSLSASLQGKNLPWRLGLCWLGFWVLMLAVGLQEYADRGGREFWRPVVDYGSAFIASSLVVVWQFWRARALKPYLSHPWQWFLRLWIWLPFIASLHIAINFGLRALVYALLETPYRPGVWVNVALYEAIKFSIFYLLFSGVHFGLLSYRAWFDAKLNAEHQTRLTQEAQLTQLTQQLQPHFLFNALNTISELIHTEPDLADQLLTQLAALLRAASDVSHQAQQSLEQEIQLLKGYGALMIQRFPDRVSLIWEIDDSLGACQVPTLSLQPLLENCFKHVVEQRVAPTRIRVSAKRSQTGSPSPGLIIEIEDDGPADDHRPQRPEGVGLSNLRQRLLVLYGARAHLNVLHGLAVGTVVRLEIPCEH